MRGCACIKKIFFAYGNTYNVKAVLLGQCFALIKRILHKPNSIAVLLALIRSGLFKAEHILANIAFFKKFSAFFKHKLAFREHPFILHLIAVIAFFNIKPVTYQVIALKVAPRHVGCVYAFLKLAVFLKLLQIFLYCVVAILVKRILCIENIAQLISVKIFIGIFFRGNHCISALCHCIVVRHCIDTAADSCQLPHPVLHGIVQFFSVLLQKLVKRHY